MAVPESARLGRVGTIAGGLEVLDGGFGNVNVEADGGFNQPR